MVRLREVEEKRIMEAAELVECRHKVKLLEQDIVDAHQWGRCCCSTEGRPMF